MTHNKTNRGEEGADIIDLHYWTRENRPGAFYGQRGGVMHENYLDPGDDSVLRELIATQVAEKRRKAMHVVQPGELAVQIMTDVGHSMDAVAARIALDAQADMDLLDREAAKELAYAARSAEQRPLPDIFIVPSRDR